MLSLRFLTSNFSVSATGNKIVNSIDSLNEAVIITRPVNLDGVYDVDAFTSIGFPIPDQKTKRQQCEFLNNCEL